MCFILICVGMFHIFLNIFDICIYMFDMLIDILTCLLICIYTYIYIYPPILLAIERVGVRNEYKGGPY